MTQYRAIDVARRFLELARDDSQARQDLSNMKLQKLCFCAQLVAVCRDESQPLISDPFHAWDYGPVEPKLFRLISKFGRRMFSLREADIAAAFAVAVPIEDSDARALVAEVWEKFKGWTAVQMSALTHKNMSPWSVVYNENRYGVIPIRTMVERRWGQPD